MKIVVIPDVHGKPYWKEICDENISDSHIVFLGDYLDGRDTSPLDEHLNFINIIKYKKEHSEKVTLLQGNHCLHYLYDNYNFNCSGFHSEYYLQWHKLYNDNRELFKIAYQYRNYLFTHAGISTKWFKQNKLLFDKYKIDKDFLNTGNVLNEIDKTDDFYMLHSVGRIRGGDLTGGVTWADINETSEGIINKLHQIVGHSRIQGILKRERIMGKYYTDKSITYTDCWDFKKEYLILSFNENTEAEYIIKQWQYNKL